MRLWIWQPLLGGFIPSKELGGDSIGLGEPFWVDLGSLHPVFNEPSKDECLKGFAFGEILATKGESETYE